MYEEIDQEFWDYYNCADCGEEVADDVMGLWEQDNIWRDLINGTGYFDFDMDEDDAIYTIESAAYDILYAVDSYMGYYDDYYY